MIRRVYRARRMHLFNFRMIAIKLIAPCAMVLAFAITVRAQTTLQVPQTQSQEPIPGVAQPQPTRAVVVPEGSEGSTLQIAPAPTAAATPAQAVAPAYQDPTAAAIAAAVNSLLTAQSQAVPSPRPTSASTPAPLMPPFTVQSTAVLPAVFRGCWQGQVAMVDHLERLPGAHKVGYWTPKTYRLCYKRLGNGPFQLTFSETGVVPDEKIVNAQGHVEALATDGRAYARMRSSLHFDEYRVDPDLRGATFAVDETTMLDCRVSGDAMAVSASVYGTRDGTPWFKALWHADFLPVPE
ncbi:MAG: hypothetical protein ACLQDV_28115 [Candidatus Binataceae bacterium]